MVALRKVWAVMDARRASEWRRFCPRWWAGWGLHELDVDDATAAKLCAMSAATIDRQLAGERKRLELKGRSGTKPGSLLKSQIAMVMRLIPRGYSVLPRCLTARAGEGWNPGQEQYGDGRHAPARSRYQSVCQMWTPNAPAFKNLGEMYVQDPRFAANYDKIAPGLAEYYRDAMGGYADTRLS